MVLELFGKFRCGEIGSQSFRMERCYRTWKANYIIGYNSKSKTDKAGNDFEFIILEKIQNYTGRLFFRYNSSFLSPTGEKFLFYCLSLVVIICSIFFYLQQLWKWNWRQEKALQWEPWWTKEKLLVRWTLFVLRISNIYIVFICF